MKAKDMPIGSVVSRYNKNYILQVIGYVTNAGDEVIALQDEQGIVILENVNDVIVHKGKA